MPKPDPVGALLRNPIHITVGPVETTIPYRTASTWIEVVLYSRRALAAVLSDHRTELTHALLRGEITAGDLESASHAALERASGRRWFVAEKLIATSLSPEMLGELTLCGVDPDRVSIGQWCAATYRVMVRNADRKERNKVDFELELPPAGETEAWDDGNDWNALLTQNQG